MLRRLKTEIRTAMITHRDENDSHALGLIQQSIQDAADANISGLPRKEKRFVFGTRSRLSLNVAFAISVPEDIWEDVSDFGRWDNGDVEVGPSPLDELPYVIGLVRQALKKPTGSGEARS